LTEQEQTLLALFNNLTEQDAQTLLRFAEFLANSDSPIEIVDEPETKLQEDEPQVSAVTSSVPKPVPIERPAEEKVVDALKRMSSTYPMLDRKKILDKASALVAQHVMFGQPAAVVINQIEEMFEKEYAQFVEDYKG